MDALFERYKASYMNNRPGHKTGLDDNNNYTGRTYYESNPTSQNAVKNTFSGPLKVKSTLQCTPMNQRTTDNLVKNSSTDNNKVKHAEVSLNDSYDDHKHTSAPYRAIVANSEDEPNLGNEDKLQDSILVDRQSDNPYATENTQRAHEKQVNSTSKD
jgi:hypothetical protein